MILTACADDDGRRLDRILRKALPEMSLSALHRLLRRGQVLVNGHAAAANERIHPGTVISIPLQEDTSNPETAAELNAVHLNAKTAELSAVHLNAKTAELSVVHLNAKLDAVHLNAQIGGSPAGLDILREDGGLLILNKPAGLAVHGGSAGGKRGSFAAVEDTLEKRVRSYLRGKLAPSLSFTPGPLHRLDKPTSGIIVFSTSLEGARRFSALLKDGKIRKRYLAILEGDLRQSEVWEESLLRDRATLKTLITGPSSSAAARPARTRVVPLKRGRKAGKTYILAQFEIDTGRTHQIRAQAAHHGHPLAGDRKYGGRGSRFFLHAAELEIPGIDLVIRAPPPEEFERAIGEIFKKDNSPR
jgi:23S rRNA pseudouridine955/2504/2580 synthase